MAPVIPESQSLSVVILGRFNPAIFQPMWFASHGILSEVEAIEASKTNSFGIVHPDITSFNTEWCKVEVSLDKFVIQTTLDPYFDKLRDFIHLTFAKLKHTPVFAFGINPEGDFKVGGEKKWHDLGDMLAPKDIWSEITNTAGLKQLVIEDSVRNDEFEGFRLYKVKPSENVEYGLHIQMNDHFSFKFDENTGTAPLLEILEKCWPDSLKQWIKVYSHMVNKV